MLGLTFEKLLLVAIIAGVVVGPRRLPGYAQQLAQMIRTLRGVVETTRSDWEAWQLDQYDPRRIVREALQDPVFPAEVLREAQSVRPGQTYLVTGSAAHPRRVLIESLPVNDPRRLAAQAAGSEPHVT